MSAEGLKSFFMHGISVAFKGTKSYYIWMSLLTVGILVGLAAYSIQLTEGLVVTGMNDYVSWGLYISNFTFLGPTAI